MRCPHLCRVEANPCTFATRRSMGRLAGSLAEPCPDPLVVLGGIDVLWWPPPDLHERQPAGMSRDDDASALVTGRLLELRPRRAIEEDGVGGRPPVRGLHDAATRCPPPAEDGIDRLDPDLRLVAEEDKGRGCLLAHRTEPREERR